MRTYLVDGTNAVRRGNYDPRFPEMEESRTHDFVDRLDSLAQPHTGHVQIEVFFDGPRRALSAPSGSIYLRFTGHETADDMILGTARRIIGEGRGVIVATEDSQLREAVAEEGAKVIGFGELHRRLESGRP